MTEERKAEIREALRKILDAILALCPAYNPLVYRLKNIRGMRTSRAASLYPEMFDPDGIKIFSELLGVSLKTTVEIEYGSLGQRIVEFATVVEDLLEKEDVQRVIAEVLGVKLEKTPIRDYVEACVDAIKEDNVALRALRELADAYYSVRYEQLISKLKEKFGVEYEKDQLLRSLQKAYDLGLLERFTDTEVGVYDRYKKHLKDVIKV